MPPKSVLILALTLALPAGACEPLLYKSLTKRLYEAGLLTPGDALFAGQRRGHLIVRGPAWTWELRGERPEVAYGLDLPVAVVEKPSGHPIVLIEADGRARELLAVPGTSATVFGEDGAGRTLDEYGLWRALGQAEFPRADAELGTAIPVARDGAPMLLWREPARGPVGWTLTDPKGRLLPPAAAWQVGDVLETADGRRVTKRADGAVVELPVSGRARALVAHLPEGALRAFLAAARRAIEVSLTDPAFPAPEQLARGVVATLDTPSATVWIGPVVRGERAALIYGADDRRWLTPDDLGPRPRRLPGGRVIHPRGQGWFAR